MSVKQRYFLYCPMFKKVVAVSHIVVQTDEWPPYMTKSGLR